MVASRCFDLLLARSLSLSLYHSLSLSLSLIISLSFSLSLYLSLMLEWRGLRIQPLSNLLRMLPPCSNQAFVFEPQSPRQAEDAAKGRIRQARDAAKARKLLLRDENALLEAAREGRETEVMLIPAPPRPPRVQRVTTRKPGS